MKLSFYSTPGHGYLRVPKKTFIDVGGDPTKISSYSGHDENTLYLEEDGDASYFIELLKNNNVEFDVKSIYKDNFSITHNYNSELFDFSITEGVKVKLCSDEIATLGFINGTTPAARTTTGTLYRIPKTNPFKYITEVLN